MSALTWQLVGTTGRSQGARIYVDQAGSTVIGRSRRTRVISIQCSREQVKLSQTDTNSARLTLMVMGKVAASSVNGKHIPFGKIVEVKKGDVIELVAGDVSTSFRLDNGSSTRCETDMKSTMSADTPDVENGNVGAKRPKIDSESSVSGSIRGGSGRPWADGLNDYINNPNRHITEIVHATDTMTAIKDKFPKAKYHFLVIPKTYIDSINVLELKHLPVVEELERVGLALAHKHISTGSRPCPFKLGFHTIPSMRRLHLHVISQDFCAVGLKTKKHWNSFTTDFFLPVDTVKSNLQNFGKVLIDTSKAKAQLKQPLRCEWCSMTLSNIPKLKAHLLTHQHKQKLLISN